jgi:hypothetical protein
MWRFFLNKYSDNKVTMSFIDNILIAAVNYIFCKTLNYFKHIIYFWVIYLYCREGRMFLRLVNWVPNDLISVNWVPEKMLVR